MLYTTMNCEHWQQLLLHQLPTIFIEQLGLQAPCIIHDSSAPDSRLLVSVYPHRAAVLEVLFQRGHLAHSAGVEWQASCGAQLAQWVLSGAWPATVSGPTSGTSRRQKTMKSPGSSQISLERSEPLSEVSMHCRIWEREGVGGGRVGRG